MISSENALLVIDMQQGLFRGPPRHILQTAVLSNICLLIEKARLARVPRIFLPATPGLITPHSQSKVR
ncbi:Isochorismatase family [Cedecea neteri]|uniref:Isochorismatase family n=1 Tax=Cedecea neteri TaxID=158822 RepID=A0A2X3JDU8_9ENTR|nr:Isochorismatase family [Cedecea neteri]